jgi:small conductance mechanosensitive channel
VLEKGGKMEMVLDRLSDLAIQGVDFLPRLVLALVTFLLSLLVARLAGRAVGRATASADRELARLLSRLVSMATLVVGTIVALDQVNVNVTGLVAGLGVAGLTVGFALQDIAKNFVAGILLLMQQPFEIGDAIEVGGHEGSVTDVDIRAVTITSRGGQQVIIPNADVFTSPIVNYSKYPTRRIVLEMGVGYEEELTRVRRIFLEAITGVAGVLNDPEPSVYCRNLGSAAVEVAAYFWIDQKQSSLFQVTSDAVEAVKQAAERESINLPYPVQTVRLRRLTDVEPL